MYNQCIELNMREGNMPAKELTIPELQSEIDSLHLWIAELSKKLSQVLGNQKHYLRHRAPEVFKMQKRRIAKAERLMEKMAAIPKINIITSYSGDKRVKRAIFMCSPNEARKLRAVLNIDFRQFNSSKTKKLHSTLNYSSKK
jgi:hypothetical protein